MKKSPKDSLGLERGRDRRRTHTALSRFSFGFKAVAETTSQTRTEPADGLLVCDWGFVPMLNPLVRSKDSLKTKTHCLDQEEGAFSSLLREVQEERQRQTFRENQGWQKLASRCHWYPERLGLLIPQLPGREAAGIKDLCATKDQRLQGQPLPASCTQGPGAWHPWRGQANARRRPHPTYILGIAVLVVGRGQCPWPLLLQGPTRYAHTPWCQDKGPQPGARPSLAHCCLAGPGSSSMPGCCEHECVLLPRPLPAHTVSEPCTWLGH